MTELEARRDDRIREGVAPYSCGVCRLERRVAALTAALEQGATDLENYASYIDDVGGSGGTALRDGARLLRNALL